MKTNFKNNYLFRILFFTLSLVLLMPSFIASAEDGQEDAYLKVPDGTPQVNTAVTVRSYSLNHEETSSDERAASGAILEVCFSNEKEVDKIEALKKAVSDETVDAAIKEAKELAKELSKNGRYKELSGYDNMYISKPVADSIPDDIYDGINHDDPDLGLAAPDPKTPHTSGTYYEGLNKKYPHIWEFYFLDDKELKEISEPEGTYWFSYFIDYTSIDQSKANYTELANTFKITEQIEIRSLEPDKEYFPTVRILEINDDGSTTEIASTDMVQNVEWYSEGEKSSFKTNSSGDADLIAVFDDLALDNKGKSKCNYIVTVDIKKSPEDTEPVLSHNDFSDTRESFNVFYDYDDLERYRTDKGEEISSYGRVKLPGAGSGSDSANRKSPDTGDDALQAVRLYSILFFLSAVGMIAIIVNRKSRREDAIR